MIFLIRVKSPERGNATARGACAQHRLALLSYIVNMPDATVVVYGKLEGASGAGKVKERWGVDLHMQFTPDPSDIAALLATTKLNQQRQVAAERARESPHSNPGWGELLREPVTSESLKTVLKKLSLPRRAASGKRMPSLERP